MRSTRASSWTSAARAGRALPDGIRFFNDRSPLESGTSCQHDVGRGGGGHMGGALIAQGREIEAGEEMLAGPEQPRRDRHVQRSEEHTSELQSRLHLVCRLLLEKKKKKHKKHS